MELRNARFFIDAEHKTLHKALRDYYWTLRILDNTFLKKRKKELTEQLKWDKISVVSEIEQLFPELIDEDFEWNVIYRQNRPDNYYVKRGE